MIKKTIYVIDPNDSKIISKESNKKQKRKIVKVDHYIQNNAKSF